MESFTFEFFRSLSIGIIVAGFLAYASIMFPYKLGGPYVPSEMDDVRQMLELADIQPGDLVVDLGAGDGRILFMAAREYGARSLGVEISPSRAASIWLKTWLFGLRRQVQVRLGNLHNVDLSQADVVTLYLMPDAVEKLETKLERELKPGSRVVTNSYPIGDRPFVTRKGFIYLYEID
jgi:cyclopropane fatty-acyl-phospholipid synthase-like methyltransferase